MDSGMPINKAASSWPSYLTEYSVDQVLIRYCSEQMRDSFGFRFFGFSASLARIGKDEDDTCAKEESEDSDLLFAKGGCQLDEMMGG